MGSRGGLGPWCDCGWFLAVARPFSGDGGLDFGGQRELLLGKQTLAAWGY